MVRRRLEAWEKTVAEKEYKVTVEIREEQIRKMVDKKVAEVLASAGVDTRRVALQVLYYLPDSFVELYEELFDRALRIAGEAPTGTEAGALGKAPSGTSGSKGNKTQLRGGQGKKYKSTWVVKDDDALDLKHRVDKRLRALARDMQSEMTFGRSQADDGVGVILGKYCPGQGCGKGKLKSEVWRFCPDCGTKLLFLDENRQVD